MPAIVERLLGGAFELDIEPGEWVVEAGSGEEVWLLWLRAVPPFKALAESLEPDRREQLHRATVDSTRRIAGRVASATFVRTSSSRRTEGAARDAPRRGDAAPAGADPPRHRQSARERDAGGRAPACLSHRARGGLRAVREGAGARQPRRPHSGPRRRPTAAAPLAHGHGARRRGGVAGRSLVGRAARRRGLGPRRAGHEGPGRRQRRRHRLARAGGLRAAPAT